MASTDDAPDPRFFGIHEGEVVDTSDPLRLGRIAVAVPGITPDDGGAWFFPVGQPGGGIRGQGSFQVPPPGSSVAVFFLGGDPDYGRYIYGPWGKPQGQSALPSTAADALVDDETASAPERFAVVHEDENFAVVSDKRDDRSRLYINFKSAGENLDLGSALMIELDAQNKTLALSAPAGIVLRSAGIVDIKAPIIQIGGRKVIQGIPEPI